MVVCLCCHSPLLRCVRHSDVYWFCPHCWQEMPNVEFFAGNPLKEYPQEAIHSYAQPHLRGKVHEFSTTA